MAFYYEKQLKECESLLQSFTNRRTKLYSARSEKAPSGPSNCRLCMCLDRVLVRGVSLPVAQLFMIAIDNILRGGMGSLTSYSYLKQFL